MNALHESDRQLVGSYRRGRYRVYSDATVSISSSKRIRFDENIQSKPSSDDSLNSIIGGGLPPTSQGIEVLTFDTLPGEREEHPSCLCLMKMLALAAATGRRRPIPLAVGIRVCITASPGREAGLGTVRFFGLTIFRAGSWVGVELDVAAGRNDGSVEGKRYFECASGYGIFVRPWSCTAPHTDLPNMAAIPQPRSLRPSSTRSVCSGTIRAPGAVSTSIAATPPVRWRFPPPPRRPSLRSSEQCSNSSDPQLGRTTTARARDSAL